MTGSADKLVGKVAIVTGAGRGVGRAIALLLAELGAKVVVNDVNGSLADAVAEEIRERDGIAFACIADVSKFEQVENLVQKALEIYGRVEILINNAAILGTTRPLEEISEAEWDLVMSVNVKGVFNCTKAVMPIMKAQCQGKIVNISSAAGRSGSSFGGAHYTASKAAVLGLTRHTACEAAPHGINVNAVAPGTIDTDMVREVIPPARLMDKCKKIPLGRLGTPQDQANLVAFLVSDRSAYITGATIDINGGMLMM